MNEVNPLEIDKFNLDGELARQADLVGDWAERVADARQAYNEAKNRLEFIEADTSIEIRNSPEAYGIQKATVDAVANAVKIDPRYQQAVKLTNTARHEMDVANAVLTGLDHKRTGLSNLVELWIRDFYSEPKQRLTDEEKQMVRRRGRNREPEEVNDG